MFHIWGETYHMSTNLEVELKVRIKEDMSAAIDRLVSRLQDGSKRSDIVRRALALYLGDELENSGKGDLGKAAAAVKRNFRK